MSLFFKNLFHPERFHGFTKTHNFFEGWYYKLINSDRSHSIAVIPGIFISKDPDKHFSFIQILDGHKDKSKFFRFSPYNFKAGMKDFIIKIDEVNIFSEDYIKLDINNGDAKIKADIKITKHLKLPSTLIEPGIMGWYSYIPFMECNHAIISMRSDIEGKFIINDVGYDFSGGSAYIEKDWGAAFPEAYVWMQGSNFDSDNPVSISGSVAIIPWIRNSFRGFIFALSVGDKIIRFATYNRSKLRKFIVDGKHISIELINPDYVLKIEADKRTAVILAAPYNGSMEGRIAESLDSVISIELSELSSGKTIFVGTSHPSAAEIAGNIDKLLSYK